LNGFADHVPETEEYGIRSFVYRARQPFHPEKLKRFINRPWPGVVRAKGFFWLATRPRFVGELSMAGALVRTEKRGLWWSAAPRQYWPDDPAWRRSMEPYFDPVWGDRRQELVFIGCDPMDEAAIRRDLDACLVKAPAFLPDLWKAMPDPFPSWETQGSMTYHRQTVRNVGVGVGLAESLQGMNLINTRGAAAVIWRRQPLREFQSWIDNLDPSCLPAARLILQPPTVREAMSHLCERSDMPASPYRDQLIDDIAALADAFAEPDGRRVLAASAGRGER
jgi:hypothetical protein